MFEKELDPNPIDQFQAWYTQACSHLWLKTKLSRIFPPLVLHQPDNVVLATVDPSGRPRARIVLLKGIEDGKFVFFTNYKSAKAQEIAQNPNVSLVFQWCFPERQVRIEGKAEKISSIDSAQYFATRSRGSQIGAWASNQSEAIDSREVLEKKVHEIEKKFEGREIPCPEFWGGYAVTPEKIEFWQARLNRLHDRLVYIRTGSGWDRKRLSP